MRIISTKPVRSAAAPFGSDPAAGPRSLGRLNASGSAMTNATAQATNEGHVSTVAADSSPRRTPIAGVAMVCPIDTASVNPANPLTY